MRSGDVVCVDFGVPLGSEPGFVRPAVVLTADNLLRGRPRTMHVVPLTSNLERNLPTEVRVDSDEGAEPSAAQVDLCTVISSCRRSPPTI